MQNSTQDQVTGVVDQAVGATKQMVGQLTGNPDLESEGLAQKVAGKVQEKLGQIEKVLGS